MTPLRTLAAASIKIAAALILSLTATIALSSCGSDDDTPPAVDHSFDHPTAFGGTTAVAVLGSSDVEETASTTYVLTFDLSARTVDILCRGANFGHGMPMAMDIEMRDVPAVIDGDSFEFAADDLIPYLGGSPFPRCPISDIYGKGRLGQNPTLDIAFICEVGMMNPPVTFNVAALSLRPVAQ